MDYEYNGNKNYSYSKYLGKEFFVAYKKSRRDALIQLSKRGAISLIKPKDTPEYLLKYSETTAWQDPLAAKIVLSFLFISHYKMTGDIRYLNNCLKLNDKICADILFIKSKLLKKMVYFSLMYELDAFNKLLAKKGIHDV